jgi:ribA/ribD-fused uncharacterized protein
MKIRTRAQLLDYVNRGNEVEYVLFWGPQESGSTISKSCFSQWYDSAFEDNGIKFPTAEHYVMYQKAKLFGDHEACEKVLLAGTPREAKAIGRVVKGFKRELWEDKRIEIVVNGNLAKFSQNRELCNFLIDTGNRVLVEASPHDPIWGIGLAQDDPASENPNDWKGLNLLGFALMEVRDQLASQLKRARGVTTGRESES